ncbi:phosphoribosylglycinamide formyltransferase [Tunicatimonas pelagia]|uniref:phosphoribosylglycinamide formyltransferase n=1 Tax=Tunicatimonas pelagia TaxID=931531 RepID=UPI002665E2BE|nr:phosphoribosylglycinamide formyltransferase [Tunicatimonas pelagia]WKN45096.1 phosphoribosylglycinamide formyltransferase [Tunicatimonas pelagia]
MKQLAVFASGSGTNAERIFERFRDHTSIRVAVLFTNNPNAGVIARAARFNIPVEIFEKNALTETDKVLEILQSYQVGWIALAGFMLMIPQNLINAFPKRIINIHPALLPAYGGKGMYGMNVHRAVVEAQEEVTGITIHYVNENYDEGAVIFQVGCTIQPYDTAETIAEKVHHLEHEYYPQIIEETMDKYEI